MSPKLCKISLKESFVTFSVFFPPNRHNIFAGILRAKPFIPTGGLPRLRQSLKEMRCIAEIVLSTRGKTKNDCKYWLHKTIRYPFFPFSLSPLFSLLVLPLSIISPPPSSLQPLSYSPPPPLNSIPFQDKINKADKFINWIKLKVWQIKILCDMCFKERKAELGR